MSTKSSLTLEILAKLMVEVFAVENFAEFSLEFTTRKFIPD